MSVYECVAQPAFTRVQASCIAFLTVLLLYHPRLVPSSLAMPTWTKKTRNQVALSNVGRSLRYMRESPEAIVQADLDALVLEQDRLRAAVAGDKRTKVATRVNAHTTEEADRVITASRAEADRVIAASRTEADRAADRIIAAVAAAAQRRRRTPAVADGGKAVAGSSTDPVAPLVGSMDSDLRQVIVKASKFGRLEHICNRSKLTYTSFGYTCRYHSQYRHDAGGPRLASSTAASVAGAAGAADAADVADDAADQEAADADDDAKLDEYAAAEEKTRSAKRTSWTAADSEDEFVTSLFAEPSEKKRRKEGRK